MAARDSATTLESQLGAVASEVRDAPRWTAVVANLTRRLPDGAWLQSLAASGDSVALVGEAAHAAEVFEALRRDAAFTGVRADAPIRREMAADRAPVERYGLTVRLAPAAFVMPREETP
jgi:Tfp pilus assembly protein PilN